MLRYFIEVSYVGKNYKGSQKQNNTLTIENEIIKALDIYFNKNKYHNLTSASRTDTGVHAKKNVFHVDFENQVNDIDKKIYALNSILPYDISINKIYHVDSKMDARFDPIFRHYKYCLCKTKNPLSSCTSLFYPYKLDVDMILKCADIILSQNVFTSFCKKHTQNQTDICNIYESKWVIDDEFLIYSVKANRFLRGMVRSLVATMLMVGRKKITPDFFITLFREKKRASAYFNIAGKGLTLENIVY